jgi:serine protease AprX
VSLLRQGRGVGLLRDGRGVSLLRQGRGVGLLSATTQGLGRVAAKGVGLLSVATLAGSGLVIGAPTAYAGVLVTGTSPEAVHSAVTAEGGSVTAELTVVDGVIAKVRTDALAALRRRPGITAVISDAAGRPQGLYPASYDPPTQVGSMYSTVRMLGADKVWATGNTGAGIGVAVIDSGVQATPAFGTRLEAGIDVTGANNPLADGYGHGTHIAGIIAGRSGELGKIGSFTGIAPNARIVSVRVANGSGATSLLNILQGMDWVYKNAGPRNIKVVNLSLGVPGYSDYRSDPLSAAAERLWRNGVVVVASAGNIGAGRGLASPAYDPFVVAVGALDTAGTVATADDAPATFSASPIATGGRGPDVIVPARSIQSLKVAGSTLAAAAPSTALVGTMFLKGSGTSQAAGEVSGLLALMLADDPTLSPDEAKAALCELSSGSWTREQQGCGVPSLATMNASAPPSGAAQAWGWSSVSGTTADLTVDAQTRLATWQGVSWQGASWQGASWQGASWQGASWQGNSWQGSIG